MGDSEYEIEVNAKSIAALEKKKGKIIREGDEDFDGFASEDEKENYYLDLDTLDEHGEEFDRVADVNADSTPLEEKDVEELGRLRDAIYEKYAKKYGVDVNELKDKVEARRLEAIEVDDEDTAIAIQKKSPDSDVRIVKK
jgi:hypothetical protein